MTFALQLPPHFSHSVDLEVLVEHTPDFAAQRGVASNAGRRFFRLAPPRRRFVVGRRGDRQNLADRLDPVGLAMIVDEPDQGLCRRSSSAIAKYADALRRISLAWRSSRFSRSKAFSRSRSSVVKPARLPPSLSDCLTHNRNVLSVAADLARNRRDRRPLRSVLAPVLLHHANRARPKLGRIALARLPLFHRSILSHVCSVLLTTDFAKLVNQSGNCGNA